MAAKILLLDIETAPALTRVWGLFDQNIGINQIVKDGYVLMWSAKWLGSPKIMWDAVQHYSDGVHGRDLERYEKRIAQSIWKLLDEADIVITHNGDEFDLKWLNATFLKHGMPPTSSYKSIDTLKESRKNFRFMSNKLEYLLRKLDLGAKIKTDFELWVQCMKGSKSSWYKMVTYCKNDVTSLEELYLEIRPFIKHHPNLALYIDDLGRKTCPNCQGNAIKKKGFEYTAVGKYQRYVCIACGKNFRETKQSKMLGKSPVTD